MNLSKFSSLLKGKAKTSQTVASKSAKTVATHDCECGGNCGCGGSCSCESEHSQAKEAHACACGGGCC